MSYKFRLLSFRPSRELFVDPHSLRPSGLVIWRIRERSHKKAHFTIGDGVETLNWRNAQ